MRPTKILHPTDYSEISCLALGEAIELARRFNASLVVLHVVHSLGTEDLTFGEVSEGPQPETHRKRLWEKLHQYIPKDSNLHIEYVLSEEEVVTSILRTAADLHCDLIVLSTHGATGWSRWLSGSVTEEVVRKSTCSVLVVKAGQAAPPLFEIASSELHPGRLVEGTD